MLQKQPININFQMGVDRKTDPYQVSVGKFLQLKNSVFDTLGRLTKRNGFPSLPALPDATTTFLTTFNDNLQALGPSLLALSSGQSGWVQKGSTSPIDLSTLPLIRNSTNQSQCDVAIAPNGLICTVYTDQNPSSLGSPIYRYCIADSVTGQNIVAPTTIPVASGVITNSPRVFLLGNYFIIVFGNLISGTTHLQYVAISNTSPTSVTGNTDIASAFTPSTALAFDGVVANGRLFLAWNGAGASGIKISYLQSNLTQGSTINPETVHTAQCITVCADITQPTPIVWVSYFDSGASSVYSIAVDFQLNLIKKTNVDSSVTVLSITSSAQNGITSVFYEQANNYSYDAAIPTHFIASVSVPLTGSVGSINYVRSVGLASKSFIVSGVVYYLAAYQSTYQPTYFLMNGSTSTQTAPIIVAKLAYSNGGGYLAKGLPSVTVNGTIAQTSYLFKDLIQSVNKNTNVASGTATAGVYTQTGINLVNFDFTSDGLQSSEMANTINITGGFLWMYDGYVPVEQNFFLWPDNVEVTTATSGGHLTDQDYYYQATYEWCDNQGNIHRSAPSIPVKQTTSGGGNSTNTINVPTLRLTYKTANPVKLVLYRWSTAQQVYYQVTSLTLPTLNNLTVDSIAITDTLADSSIIGNNILYTNGGVIENTNAPGTKITTLFDDRVWLVDAEDQNLLWYSKQVIEATPVEMSDLLTFYVAPSIGTQGSTGVMQALSAMDDKLIIFKKNAIYYVNGSGPDNTGANNQYSQPTFVTSSVGTDNTRSVVITPVGVMFQSDKGIWLLGRDLSTKYIGAPVEAYNQFPVTSATTIPETNQVRFALSNGLMLMYDYFVDQWGVFEGIPSISSCVYNGLHTIVNQYGKVSQESPGTYLDGSNPVLISFLTSWLNLAGLRGYERAYFFFLLGTYLSPHKLQIEIAYDYDSAPVQSNLYVPNNYSGTYGSDPFYGGDGTAPFGGVSNIEQFRVFLERQRCKAFQISIQEVFDPSFGTVAGAGLTISGLNVQAAFKKGYAPISAARSIG